MELNQKSEAETLSNLIGKMRGKGSRKRSRNDTAATQQTPAKHSKVDGSCQTENTVEQVRLFDDDESDNPGTGTHNIVHFASLLEDSNTSKGNPLGRGGDSHRNMDQNSNSDLSRLLGSGIEPMRSTADDIAMHVPQSIKEQIWRGDYVHLNLLLKGALELSELSSGQALYLSPSGLIESKPKGHKGKNLSIEKWTDAFLIYTSILLHKTPTLCQDLIKYMSIIREASTKLKGFAWVTYDEQFRLRQAHYPSSWASINQELWLRCMALQETSTGSVTFGVALRPNTCNAYNRGHCTFTNCRFAHNCSSCGAQHPRVTCGSKNSTYSAPAVPENRVSNFRGPSGGIRGKAPSNRSFPKSF